MRVLVLFAHPVESSYGAALHERVLENLATAGHVVDDCDLYREGFDPILSRHDRLVYHEIPENRKRVAPYIQRLERAEALIIVSPVWNFGFPAILKGYFDRVWVPGVTFDMVGGKVKPKLTRIRKLAAVMTYGGGPLRAFLAGDPPRKIVTRVLRATVRPLAPVRYLAHYDMNRSTDETRARFITRVGVEMAQL